MPNINFDDLQQLIAIGEDSGHQWKRDFINADSLAAEMVAFSNGDGGTILVGVNDDGTIAGLSVDDVRRLNQLISNVASQNVRPAINPITRNVVSDDKIVMAVTIPKGVHQPYQDKDGVFWVKSGADKRKATAVEELQRMFAKGNLFAADEQAVSNTSIEDFDLSYFSNYFKKNYEEDLSTQTIPLENLLDNMHLMKNDNLTVAGYLLFSKHAFHFKLPAFIVKAVSFFGNSIEDNTYIDSRDITGKMEDVFRGCINFLDSNLRHIQVEPGFNSVGRIEIPLTVLHELIVNALIHRDYLISAPIRLFVFKNRIEIITPGHLPNTLSIESIKMGTSNMRNALLSSFALHILPYRGIGTGIKRAIKEYPHITFEDDRVCNQFKVTIERLAIKKGGNLPPYLLTST